jgi:aldehyde:ferredoxin oxidoreductase
MCFFGSITSTLPVVEYLNAVTGWDLSADQYFKTGERILSLRKAFNAREGVTPEDHRINARAVGNPPLASGPLKNVSVDTEGLKTAFFQTMGWDLTTGGPTPKKMAELGIDHLSK